MSHDWRIPQETVDAAHERATETTTMPTTERGIQ